MTLCMLYGEIPSQASQATSNATARKMGHPALRTVGIPIAKR